MDGWSGFRTCHYKFRKTIFVKRGVMMALLAMLVIGIAIAGMFLYLAETI